MKKMKNFCDISTCWNPGKLSCPSGQLSCWRVSSSSFSLPEFPAAHPGSSDPTFQQVEMSQNSSFFSLLHFSFFSFSLMSGHKISPFFHFSVLSFFCFSNYPFFSPVFRLRSVCLSAFIYKTHQNTKSITCKKGSQILPS